MKNEIKNLADSAKEKFKSVDYKNWAKDSTANLAGWAAVLNQDNLFKWVENLKFSTSQYDQAMDNAYNAAKEGAGGGNHRLFDGGHTLVEAWDKVKNASPDDTFSEEVIGYFKALWNDASTVKGLPFKTLDQNNYNEWVDKISEAIPGIPKKWLYDLTSFDAIELTGAGTGAIGAIFMMSKGDQKRFSEIIGTMGVSSVMGANPIMGLSAIALVGYSYFVKKHELDKSAFAKSAALTGLASMIFAVLGMPFLIELVIVMVVSSVVRKKVLENDELIAVVKHHVAQGTDKTRSLMVSGLKKLLDKLDVDKDKIVA